jgi:site-specific recombinase XerD
VAFLYQQKKSHFWWIEFRDAAGVVRRRSTKLRADNKEETRKARRLRDELRRREYERRDSYPEQWTHWVPQFLEQRYKSSPKTYNRYLNSWRNISAFLATRSIVSPRQLTRQHVRDFIDWRKAGDPDPKSTLSACCHNTALHEVKLLRIVMREAVESGFADNNPCSSLGIRKEAVAIKPAITPAEHQVILKALRTAPEWMQISYTIAWYQGCRFSETCLPLSNVDLSRGTITFHAKGGKDFTAPLAEELRPLFARLKSEKTKTTFAMPPMPGKAWWLFFKHIRLRHLCFHCTRVTFITRCYQAGLPEHVVMRLVGHASTTVHRIYPRLAVETDLQSYLRKLSQPAALPNAENLAA